MIVTRRAAAAEMAEIMEMEVAVFHGEQKIPMDLVPIPEELSPVWWCLEEDGEVVGAVAGYTENSQFHMGRFLIRPDRRGHHLGTGFLHDVFAEVFSGDTEIIYMDARDVTVHIVTSFGGEITGKPEPFYEGLCTPIVLEKKKFR